MKSKILEILKHPHLALALPDPESAVEPLIRFCELWRKWNQKINLTSEKDWQSFFEKHVFDSLQFARFIEPDQSLMDIGSGGGFPGIPLKILHPGNLVVLVESQRKRAGFLNTVGVELKFSEFKVINQRIEDLQSDQELTGRFDRVVFRAVTETRECLQWARPFLAESGQVIVKKPLNETETLGNPEDVGYKLETSVEIQDYHSKPSQMLAFSIATV